MDPIILSSFFVLFSPFFFLNDVSELSFAGRQQHPNRPVPEEAVFFLDFFESSYLLPNLFFLNGESWSAIFSRV